MLVLVRIAIVMLLVQMHVQLGPRSKQLVESLVGKLATVDI